MANWSCSSKDVGIEGGGCQDLESLEDLLIGD